MRVVIDMQGAQTESRFRGIGRYALSFVKAVVRNRGDAEIVLVLSDLFPETVEAIRSEFAGTLPPAAIRVWSSPGPVRECEPGNDARREVAEMVREAFIATLRPDVVHVTSLFEGFVDDAVTSVGALAAGVPVTVALYDLIPLSNPAHYLDHDPAYRAYYQRKIEWLRRAAGFLAISEYSRCEGRDLLGLEDGLFHDVSTAIESGFADAGVDDASVPDCLAALSIREPFVLYTGGSDGRKNLERLIEAYARIAGPLPVAHQLVLAGRMPDGDIARLRAHACGHGISDGDIVFTGYVSDAQLVTLYRQCACFVFPSWHEGFGLPALEAMACGAPVIGSAASSIVEVINADEAMFDPFDVGSIAERLDAVLRDREFADRLRRHGAAQARRYSWDRTASRALAVWRELTRDGASGPATGTRASDRRLALVTPLPPERSGIANYSAELLPELARRYRLDVVVDQDTVEMALPEGVAVCDVAWFRRNAHLYDRIVYQVGNSPFHRHMIALMDEHPGALVLHDFFLSSLFGWLEDHGGAPGAWTRAVHASHGLKAVARKLADPPLAKIEYPSSFEPASAAIGICVHSQYARELLCRWYGLRDDVAVVPHLRAVEASDDTVSSRESLGLAPDAFVVCSFGFIDSSKLNHLLLDAWAESSLANSRRCHLVFVGENHGGDYGKEMLRRIRSFKAKHRVEITGFVDGATYRQYLRAADVAVQLRTASRGESSGAILDCMGHGVPLIVNANGSLAETPSAGAIVLEDHLQVRELSAALERMKDDRALRESLSRGARAIVDELHSPGRCASLYFDAIESAYARAPAAWQARLYARLNTLTGDWSSCDLDRLSRHLVMTFPERGSARRLLLDVTATVGTRLHTGIERVARGVTAALLRQESPELRIEPVYLDAADGTWRYRHARGFALQLQNAGTTPALYDDLVDPRHDDVLLSLDISGAALVSAVASGLLARYRRFGVRAYAMLFDLLPITMPEVFPPGAGIGHRAWLESVATLDGAVCISHAVADDMRVWMEEAGQTPGHAFELLVSHLGADIERCFPSVGLPDQASQVLDQLSALPTFLMVGSIEPRKGYLQAIEAFSQLWNEGLAVNLVIVGREGWLGLDEAARRDIPDTVECLRSHPERGRRLHWLSDASDEYLGLVYAQSSCLLAASYGEGFGLPLIEAAEHGVPLLLRDIPVFREVAGEAAVYFDADTPSELASAVRGWLALSQDDLHPSSAGLARTTWAEMAAHLRQALVGPNEEAMP